MSLLDRVIAADDEHLLALVEMHEGIPFFTDNGVPAWIGMEYMAQSIAALAGHRAQRDGRPIPLGLLIGCRQFKTRVAAFESGTALAVEVRELVSDGEGLGAFACTIYAVAHGIGDCATGGDPLRGAEILAEAQLTVYGGQVET
jgi:predicted hotdog family 3-hydroxylacyl-ACP dehydratase